MGQKNLLTSPTNAVSPYDKSAEINFRFGEKSKVQPSGMEKITANQEVTVLLKGKITSFSSGEPYDKSKRFTLFMNSCEIMSQTEPKEISMDAALTAADKTRKAMK